MGNGGVGYFCGQRRGFAMIRSLLAAVLITAVAGCGTERAYFEQEAVLPAGAGADVERFFLIVEVVDIGQDQSVSMISYVPACMDGEKLRVERFTLTPGQTYVTQHKEIITVLSADAAAGVATIRGGMFIELRRSLFPRPPHALEKPPPEDVLDLLSK